MSYLLLKSREPATHCRRRFDAPIPATGALCPAAINELRRQLIGSREISTIRVSMAAIQKNDRGFRIGQGRKDAAVN